MDHIALKTAIRKTVKNRRAELTTEDRLAKSARIFAHWKAAFDLKGLSCIHLFLTMDRFHEIETSDFRSHILRQDPPISIAIPVMTPDNKALQHVVFGENLRIEKNHWGIPEPVADRRYISPADIDMVLLPMLAFDDHGNRLGYGKGHYDRFLQATRPDCLKIGLCMEMGHWPENLPAEPHDVPLDYVVTEEKVYDFRK